MWLVGSKPIKSNVVQQHLFRAFCVIANSWRSPESTVSFAQMTSCAIRYDVIYVPFAMNSQYLKTWVGWQPCRSHRRRSKHKEWSWSFDVLWLTFQPFRVLDASAETPSSSASLKETVEKPSKNGQLVAQSKSHRSSSKRKLEEASKT